MKAYVVYCHPRHDTLCGAALQRVLAGLAAGGHEVRIADLYADEFVPELSAHDRSIHLVDHRARPDQRPDIGRYADDLRWCDTLIFVYPTWWAGQPAMLKGWLDRVLVPGVAWELPEGANRLRPLLHNVRRIIAVTTHGSPKRINALEGESGKRIVTRSVRVLCNRWCRTHWIACYGVDRMSQSERGEFLADVERRIARLSR